MAGYTAPCQSCRKGSYLRSFSLCPSKPSGMLHLQAEPHKSNYRLVSSRTLDLDIEYADQHSSAYAYLTACCVCATGPALSAHRTPAEIELEPSAEVVFKLMRRTTMDMHVRMACPPGLMAAGPLHP